MKLSDVVKGIEGTLISDGEFETMNYCTAEINERFLTFVERSKFISKVSSKVTCVICSKDMADQLPEFITGIFVTEEPKYRFHQICNKMNIPSERKYFKTVIGNNSNISPMAHVPSNNVIIGNNVTIEPFVMIGENVTIKDNCIIHANSIIGGRSFSEARSISGEICGLNDMGQVVLEDNVEIFAGVHIAQGIWSEDITYIGEYSKIDALCYIGHGAKLGRSVLVAAGVNIGGNTKIGDNSWIGMNATVSNRLNVGAHSRISLGAVVTKDVMENTTVTGNFAIEHSKFISYIKNINQ